MIRNAIWNAIAYIASRPAVVDWLVVRANRTPYTNITNKDGTDIYMKRDWVFNPYGVGVDGSVLPARWGWLPSVRVHHIMRADKDRHLHDHPWNARTIVLRGWYKEERPAPAYLLSRIPNLRVEYAHRAGYTGRLLFGQYHRISEVSPGGVYTLFFAWKYRGTWGFDVNGKKVPWREYLNAGNEQ